MSDVLIYHVIGINLEKHRLNQLRTSSTGVRASKKIRTTRPEGRDVPTINFEACTVYFQYIPSRYPLITALLFTFNNNGLHHSLSQSQIGQTEGLTQKLVGTPTC